MLLIQEPSSFKLYEEISNIAGYFIAPVFTLALILEYLGEMNFLAVLKKLVIVSIFMGSFYTFHSISTDIALKTASQTLKKVSPRNLFLKKWYEQKIKTKSKTSWGSFKSFFIPNINDLVAMMFFVLASEFIWLLKLIYSSVYHLTYIFSSIAAVLYFLGWTKDSLKGIVQSSLWCIIQPFVLVGILALIGNSIDSRALDSKVATESIENLVWLLGIATLILMTPLITFMLIRGDGISGAGAKMGGAFLNMAGHGLRVLPTLQSSYRSSKSGLYKGRSVSRKIQSKARSLTGKDQSIKSIKNGSVKSAKKELHATKQEKANTDSRVSKSGSFSGIKQNMNQTSKEAPKRDQKAKVVKQNRELKDKGLKQKETPANTDRRPVMTDKRITRSQIKSLKHMDKPRVNKVKKWERKK